jgi:hypothetical protein
MHGIAACVAVSRHFWSQLQHVALFTSAHWPFTNSPICLLLLLPVPL